MSWDRIFVTGDPHGNFKHIKLFTEKAETTKSDLLIIVGDVGLNYNYDENDRIRKQYLFNLPLSFLLVRGNHEGHPETVPGMQYSYLPEFSSLVFFEKEFPGIYYINAGQFVVNDIKCLAIGGAYSVDKEIRILSSRPWFYDEQPTVLEKRAVDNAISLSPDFDFVFTHSCPYDLIPRHLFLSQVDQSKVDTRTEEYLQEVYNKINFKTWYCGHYHGDEWLSNSVRLLYKDFLEVRK